MKIYKTADVVIGTPVSGFMDCDPFTADSYVTTGPVEEVGDDWFTAGGDRFTIERVDKSTWVPLMAQLDAFRNPVKNNRPDDDY